MQFKRARQESQKAERRSNILMTAAQLCSESGVFGWSVNELGKRAAVTKSNLYSYFNSREEILLVLMYEEIEQFAKAFIQKIQGSSCSVSELCALMAQEYQDRPLLCNLLCSSSAILEKNSSSTPVLDMKLSGLKYEQEIATAIASGVDGISFEAAQQFTFASGIIVIGLWPMSRPDAPLHKFTNVSGLERLSLDFARELEKMLYVHLSGITRQA